MPTLVELSTSLEGLIRRRPPNMETIDSSDALTVTNLLETPGPVHCRRRSRRHGPGATANSLNKEPLR